ncbi:molybdopterin-synthase adenylyltransferase MoeB [Zemynaea arenosa]|uniref:molybdopterin-synthase adenylyltransferase MoeB n=1 Tax=Zemynaea arenosa TaxID=2561931 RepID=UPI0015E1867B|nr:molybdopterin-synthase adenylyltransferase MoeB [Massilia arenosa]
MTTFLIPTPLRGFTEGHADVQADGATVREALTALTDRHPRLRDQLFDGAGALRSFVNLFLNGDDIRLYDGLDTAVHGRDTVEVLPAIAGGEQAARSYANWRRDLQATIPTLTAREAAELHDAAVIDVRTAEEWAQGHMPGAVHIDRGFLELRIEALVPDRGRTVVVYCQSGVRSLFAANALRYLGYADVRSLAGGIEAWKQEGLELAVPARLDEQQRKRYLRHLAMPEVGIEGQARLLKAKVLMIGAGGLGCPAALYLAAAGVGTLGIVDSDIVDLSNLQRQVLHRTATVGQPKTESAREALLALNPDLNVKLYNERLDASRAAEIFKDYDLVVDGTDNFTTRYVINDAAVALGIPVVHGSVYRFEGQVGVFWAKEGPCYRCLYPAAPPPELAPSCADAGVLGVMPGVIGVMQATETLKLLLGIGEPLIGRSLRYDALTGQVRTLRFARDPQCACGQHHGAAEAHHV